MTIQNRAAAENLLVQVARMSVKAGEGIRNGAGWGYVGMLNGLTVKLATHYGERHSHFDAAGTQQACDSLRENLLEAANQYLNPNDAKQEEAIRQVKALLGIKDNDNGVAHKPLITRSIALRVVTTIRDAARDQALSGKINDLEGEATIRNSRADHLLDAHQDAVDRKATFLNRIQSLVQHYIPGVDNPECDKVMDAVKQSFVFRSGDVRLRGLLVYTLGNEGDNAISGWAQENMRPSDTIPGLLGKILENADDPKCTLFQESVAKLFVKLTEQGANDRVASLLMNSVEPTAERPIPVIPSTQSGAASWQKAFAFLKAIATTLYPADTETGRKCFQTWLMTQAAAASHTTVEALTPRQFADFVRAHWDDPDMRFKPSENGRSESICGRFDDITAYDHFGEMRQDMQIDKNAVLTALQGGYGADRLYRLLTARSINKKGPFMPDNTFECGGALVSKHAETFTYDDTGREVTSTVTPARKYVTSPNNAQIANLAHTELVRDGVTLFRAVRFGSCNTNGAEKNTPRQYAHYGQLVEATLLSDTTRRADLHDGEEINLPLFRIDMSEDASLKTCADTYHLVIDGKHVTVHPKVVPFRVITDSATVVTLKGGDKAFRLMSSSEVTTNDVSLDKLVIMANEKTPEGSFERRLAQKLRTYWKELKARHCDLEGNLQLFEGFGAEMMQFGARIALLASKLGNVPSFNCNGGRDRTGLMDVETKTLALHLADHPDDVPEIDYQGGTLKPLRTRMRNESGNQEIAREIKLNDDDMYTNQVDGICINLEKAHHMAAPVTIRPNSGVGEELPWVHVHRNEPGVTNRYAGLDALYV